MELGLQRAGLWFLLATWAVLSGVLMLRVVMNVPPWNPGPARNSWDYCSKDGAETLARTLVYIWRRHGYQTVTAEPYVAMRSRDNKRGEGTIWGVRTNLVGGLPPRAAS